MNADHAIGGVAATSVTAMLATVLQYWQHGLDTATAAAEAGLIVLAVGAVAGLVQRLIAARAGKEGEAPHA